MVEKDFSLPYLEEGKFQGRALAHIEAITSEKADAVRAQAEAALAQKVGAEEFKVFKETLASGVPESEALSALAAARAEVQQEATARQAADAKLQEKIDAIPGDELSLYTGGSFDLGSASAGRMVGILAQGSGSIAGQDVSPGQVWVFVSDGSTWTGYRAGGGGASAPTSALVRPVLSASQVTARSARVSWPAASGAVSYEGRVAGGMIQEVNSPWDIAGLSMATSYTVEVRAVDQAGQKSAWATVSFKTGEAPAEPLELQTNTTDGSITITTTAATNDSTLATGAAWGKYATSKKSLPGAGYVEFTVTKPASLRYGVGLNGGGAGTGAGTIGVYINPSGAISMTGGSYAGGVDSKSTVAAGSRLRLGRTAEARYIEQKQGSSWVRLGAQAVSGALTPTKLSVFGGGQPTAWEVVSVAGAGWA